MRQSQDQVGTSEEGVVEGCKQYFSVLTHSQYLLPSSKCNQSKECEIENEEEIGDLPYIQNGTVVPYRFGPEYTEAELFHLQLTERKELERERDRSQQILRKHRLNWKRRATPDGPNWKLSEE